MNLSSAINVSGKCRHCGWVNVKHNRCIIGNKHDRDIYVNLGSATCTNALHASIYADEDVQNATNSPHASIDATNSPHADVQNAIDVQNATEALHASIDVQNAIDADESNAFENALASTLAEINANIDANAGMGMMNILNTFANKFDLVFDGKNTDTCIEAILSSSASVDISASADVKSSSASAKSSSASAKSADASADASADMSTSTSADAKSADAKSADAKSASTSADAKSASASAKSSSASAKSSSASAKSADASADASADMSTSTSADAKSASVDTSADAKSASVDTSVDTKSASADVTSAKSADAKSASANAGADASASMNILNYHKAIFIEMVTKFRKNVTVSDINREIIKYRNELDIKNFKDPYLLKDFKNEIITTFLPILQILFINHDIRKELAENIIQEIQNIINNSDQLMLLLLEFSIFLKISQPSVYAASQPSVFADALSIEDCIYCFLNSRIQSDLNISKQFIIYNNQNMVLYNIFFLFSKKLCNSHSSKLILTTEFLELTINTKIKNIMQISRDNKYKRMNLHLFQCTHCGEIFNDKLLTHCTCGQTFCSKGCQITAWSTWHKELCPDRQAFKRQCLGCMQYFEKQDIFKCTQCMSARYCGKECQRRDWEYHKVYCNAIFDSI